MEDTGKAQPERDRRLWHRGFSFRAESAPFSPIVSHEDHVMTPA
jgi:hypothetical protein